MEIQKNSRQIPSNEVYTADKDYSDILYGYLQHHSSFDKMNKVRYILKKDISYTDLAEKLKMHRQTISKKFRRLMDKGLIKESKEDKRYILMPLEPHLAALLPDDTVRICCNTLQERCLSLLAYLLKTYIQNGEKPFIFNFDFLKEYLGLGVKNRSYNNQIIKDCLVVLKQLGFIEYHKENREDPKTKGIITVYILDKANNVVSFLS